MNGTQPGHRLPPDVGHVVLAPHAFRYLGKLLQNQQILGNPAGPVSHSHPSLVPGDEVDDFQVNRRHPRADPAAEMILVHHLGQRRLDAGPADALVAVSHLAQDTPALGSKMQTGSNAGSSPARSSSPSHRFRRSRGNGRLPGRPFGGISSLVEGKTVMVTGIPWFGAAPRAHSSCGVATVAGAISCGPSLPARFTPLETCRMVIPGHSLGCSRPWRVAASASESSQAP